MKRGRSTKNKPVCRPAGDRSTNFTLSGVEGEQINKKQKTKNKKQKTNQQSSNQQINKKQRTNLSGDQWETDQQQPTATHITVIAITIQKNT
jgi:hypothetical protein